MTTSHSVGARVRALGSQPGLTIGATIGVLLVLVPAIVLVALIGSGHAGDTGGLVFLGVLLATGVWVVVSTLREAGKTRMVPGPDPSGIYGPTLVPAAEGEPSRYRPARIVLTLLAVLALGSLIIAIFFSIVDDYTHDKLTVWLIVRGVVLVALFVVGWILRRVSRPRT